jgi:hypothetical protein
MGGTNPKLSNPDQSAVRGGLTALEGFEVITAVTVKNGVFWDVTPCGCCKNRRFGGT